MNGWEQLFAPTETAGRFYGVTTGLVTSNEDPDGLGRIKVAFPWLSDVDTSHWARIATPMAGMERGFFFLPEVNDEVLVAFEQGMMEHPYILGALWNGADKPPESNSDGKNNMRTIKSRSGHIIRLDDTEGAEKIEIIDKSEANSIVIDSANNTLTISAEADITIQAGNGKLILSGKGVEITSQAEIKMEASKNLDIKAGPELNIKGQAININ